MKDQPKWKRAERIMRETSFELKAPAAAIFPLLCPVREYEWIPDWSCEMIYSESGVAEKDAVFHTRELLGKRAVWSCITYEPPRLIEYLIVLGSSGVLRLSIDLEESPACSTRVTWTMSFTISKLMTHLSSKISSRAGYEAMIASRRLELEGYLAKAEA